MHPIRNQTIDLGVLKALDPGTGHDVARDGDIATFSLVACIHGS